jgi:hypothetical protein
LTSPRLPATAVGLLDFCPDFIGMETLENIVVYCTCVANGSADVITTDDLEYFQRGGKSTPASEQRARAIGLACLEMGFVQGHWRLNPECEATVRARRPLRDCPSARMLP